MPKLNDIQEFLADVQGWKQDHAAATQEIARLDAKRAALVDAGKAIGFEKGAVREMLDEVPAEAADAPTGDAQP